MFACKQNFYLLEPKVSDIQLNFVFFKVGFSILTFTSLISSEIVILSNRFFHINKSLKKNDYDFEIYNRNY